MLQDYSDFSDLEDELDEEKTGLRGKIKRFQYVLVIVQDILGVIGDYEEKLKKYVLHLILPPPSLSLSLSFPLSVLSLSVSDYG